MITRTRLLAVTVAVVAAASITVAVVNFSGRDAGPSAPVTFTTGDLPGVPLYPDVEQSTSSSELVIPDEMVELFEGVAVDWKRYATSDEVSEVLDWYETELAEAGFTRDPARPSGVVSFARDEHLYALYVTSDGELTTIVLAGSTEPITTPSAEPSAAPSSAEPSPEDSS